MSNLSKRSIYDIMRDAAETPEQLEAIDTVENVINLSLDITHEFIKKEPQMSPNSKPCKGMNIKTK